MILVEVRDSRGTLEEVGDGFEDGSGGPEWVGETSLWYERVGGPTGRSGTGRGTIEEV